MVEEEEEGGDKGEERMAVAVSLRKEKEEVVLDSLHRTK